MTERADRYRDEDKEAENWLLEQYFKCDDCGEQRQYKNMTLTQNGHLSCEGGCDE